MHVCSWAPGHKLVHTAGAVPVVGQRQDDLQVTARIEQTDEKKIARFDIEQRKAQEQENLAVSFPVEPDCGAS